MGWGLRGPLDKEGDHEAGGLRQDLGSGGGKKKEWGKDHRGVGKEGF